MIAVGVLVPLGRFDNLLARLAASRPSACKVGLLLTGSIAALVYAYLVRLLAVALQTMDAGLAKITPSMDDAARSLGAGPGAALARVHLPLLAPSLATAALLVFVDVLKELPATLRAAAVQLRHAGDRGLQPGEGRAAGRGRRCPRWRSSRSACLRAGACVQRRYVKRYFQATRS